MANYDVHRTTQYLLSSLLFEAKIIKIQLYCKTSNLLNVRVKDQRKISAVLEIQNSSVNHSAIIILYHSATIVHIHNSILVTVALYYSGKQYKTLLGKCMAQLAMHAEPDPRILNCQDK